MLISCVLRNLFPQEEVTVYVDIQEYMACINGNREITK